MLKCAELSEVQKLWYLRHRFGALNAFSELVLEIRTRQYRVSVGTNFLRVVVVFRDLRMDYSAPLNLRFERN